MKAERTRGSGVCVRAGGQSAVLGEVLRARNAVSWGVGTNGASPVEAAVFGMVKLAGWLAGGFGSGPCGAGQ